MEADFCEAALRLHDAGRDWQGNAVNKAKAPKNKVSRSSAHIQRMEGEGDIHQHVCMPARQGAAGHT